MSSLYGYVTVTLKLSCEDIPGSMISQGRPGFWGIQYIGVLNFRYTVLLCLKLGIEYSLTTNFGSKVYRVFLNFGILHKF